MVDSKENYKFGCGNTVMVELISSVADLGKGPRSPPPPPLLSSRSGSVTDHTVTQLLHTFAAVQQSLEEINHISIKKLEEKTPCFRYTSIEKLLCCKSCKINVSLE